MSETQLITGDVDGGGRTYRAASGFNGNLFEVRSGSLRNCTLIGHGVAYGVLVTGSDTALENVVVNQFQRGIQIENCQRVTARNCRSSRNRDFGFNAEYCTDVTFDSCDSQYNGLDGFKLRAMARDTVYTHCYAAYNGQQYPTNAGDGIDVFGGGMGVLIQDSLFEFNQGYGLLLKTDSFSRDAPEVYGIPENATVRRCVCQNNLIWGIAAVSTGGITVPLYRHVAIEDTQTVNNGFGGLWIDAGDLLVNNLIAAPNQPGYPAGIPYGYGVYIGSRSENVTLANVTGTVFDVRV